MNKTAQGLAALGRGPDTELVHMTKGEVAGLQSLAQRHGGSLTINPATGLPEASFLESILPAVIKASAIPIADTPRYGDMGQNFGREQNYFPRAGGAASGIESVYNPQTGQFVGSEGPASKYTYDPRTQTYGGGETQAAKLIQGQFGPMGGEPGGSVPEPSPWSQLTPAEQAAFYAANPVPAAITQAGIAAFGRTSPGFVQNLVSPHMQPAMMAVAKGFTPQETFRQKEIEARNLVAQQEAPQQSAEEQEAARQSAQEAFRGLEYEAANKADVPSGPSDGPSGPSDGPSGPSDAPSDSGGADAGSTGDCVDPNVRIMMADRHYVRAGDIKVGDVLYAMHEKTLEFGEFPVEHAEEVQQPKAIVMFNDGSTMITSHSHKFLMADGAWQQVYQLQPGYVVKAAPGNGDKTVAAVEPLGEGAVMKITVKDAHTYISEGLISHNMKARGGVVRQRYALGGITALGNYGAAGGPVEAMSNANAIGANTGYPQANLNTRAYATPYQQPMPQNVITATGASVDPYTGQAQFAVGGLTALAGGGSAQYNLGGYSDGGRLLRGPGDGVSDNIPAVIGRKQPARLADGEFVIPARIVSEIGNGSTEAGARRLYAMMDRIQKARKKSIGKTKVAVDSKAHRMLPA